MADALTSLTVHRDVMAETAGAFWSTTSHLADELVRRFDLPFRMAHQIVWLNPLLRFDGFEPRAAGVRALLPNVDRFLPVHNLASLADLGRALRAPASNNKYSATK